MLDIKDSCYWIVKQATAEYTRLNTMSDTIIRLSEREKRGYTVIEQKTLDYNKERLRGLGKVIDKYNEFWSREVKK
jgi:hypothetical protein